MKLTIPKKLNPGDTIGVISPSAGLFPIFPHRIKQAENNLEKMGYHFQYAKHAAENSGYVSSSIKSRVDDIHEMFLDPKIKAIICSIGGNHSNQLLKYLDFEIIKNNPKIFVGYSDITVLHFALASQANLRTYYGPCVISEFGEYPDILDYTKDSFKRCLCQTNILGPILQSKTWTDEVLDWMTKQDQTRARTMQPYNGYEWWREGHAEAEIFGGCIPSINHLAGTKYWVDINDKIFFIDLPESTPGQKLPFSELDAYLADLDNLGIFKNIKGLIIGQPYSYGPSDHNTLKEIILKYVEAYDYPILYQANIGHASPIITLPLGARTLLDSNHNSFEILEAGVK